MPGSVAPNRSTDQPVELGHLIAGAWEGAGEVDPDRNPARPGEIVAFAPRGDANVVARASEAARAALPAWARMPAPGRGEILFRASDLLVQRADAIGRELSREEGKTLAEGVGEVRRASLILRYFAGRTVDRIGEVYASASVGTRITTVRQPLGVVAVIAPWNFPIAIPAWKIAPALAYGNTVVFKPAGATPLTAYRLVQALVDAGLPSGVLNLVFASGPIVSDALMASSGVNAWSFTGSAEVGRELHRRAIEIGAKVQLELGGKNAVVVAPDADIERAADAIVRGGYASAGQKCTATSRVIAIGTAMEPLRAALIERVHALHQGDPLESTTSLGPLIDDAAQERVAAMLADAERDGARVVTRTLAPSNGAFHPAVLLDHVDPTMSVAREEIFGPVVGLIAARDTDEAMRLHNAVAYGLSASIFTRDLRVADRFVHEAQAGIVHVNGETAGAEPHVPFGGMKGSSSWSREQGVEAEHFFTQTKVAYWDDLSGAGLFDS